MTNYYKNILVEISIFEDKIIKARLSLKDKDLIYDKDGLDQFLKMLEFQSIIKIGSTNYSNSTNTIVQNLEKEIVSARNNLFQTRTDSGNNPIEYENNLSQAQKDELLQSFNDMLGFENSKGIDNVATSGFLGLWDHAWISKLKKNNISTLSIGGGKFKRRTKSKKSKKSKSSKSKKKIGGKSKKKYKSKYSKIKTKKGGKSKSKKKSKKSKRYAKK